MGGDAEEELKNFIQVWISALAALAYSYFASSAVPRGALRLLSLLPAVLLLSLLPLRLSSAHLGGPTAFFLVWLANFKLLLLSFHLGPLADAPSFLHFLSLASLPVKVKPPRDDKKVSGKSPKSTLASVRLAIKVLILVSILHAYEYRPRLHEYAILALYCVHLYLELELVLAICAVPASAALGFDLERQFDEPYLATSLQDFWGRRWNLMVSSILRSTVYDPVRRRLAPLIGSRPASLPATVAAFAVSGVMHEAIYYYITRARPTGEVTWFFTLHGICVAAEVAVKRWAGGRWRMHRAASGMLTAAFLMVTGMRWFFPQLMRNGVHEKVISECYAIFHFGKDELTRFIFHIKSEFM
ncbi:long-chain-alcohol O-fatty-acyltransferase-like [Rhodamnia argentea]|uniref:Long-chain-alcohol O-fatty-acyltransferase-like n=1 Tax=Rhodamnia argentea TaxID=178133 RepID=A0A8B8NLU5_9MYRT|nr:long-chain-alcohol O-fatty-acyltransferase-like [Rhodamnia argentea]